MAATNFEDEAGVKIEDIGGIVLDEVSFIDLPVFGHVDEILRTLLKSASVLCGGMPLLLAGDCHQKPPPASIPWHQVMVKVAIGEGEQLRALGATVAKTRGLELLRAARRVELTRLTRAAGDEEFIQYQRDMRRAGVHRPVAEDGAWRFAPIGVLSHVERDTLNLAQLHAFACEFRLPLVRWRLPLVDDAFTDAFWEQLYENEPNLWGYFVAVSYTHLTLPTT